LSLKKGGTKRNEASAKRDASRVQGRDKKTKRKRTHSLLRPVGHELEGSSEILVPLGEPLEKRLRLLSVLHLETGGLVHELLSILGRLLVGKDDDLLCKNDEGGKKRSAKSSRKGRER